MKLKSLSERCVFLKVVDRSTQPSCPTATPAPPTIPPSTTRTTTAAPLVNNVAASGLFKTFICKGSSRTIEIPNNYRLFIINSYYGVTLNGSCSSIGYASRLKITTLNFNF